MSQETVCVCWRCTIIKIYLIRSFYSNLIQIKPPTRKGFNCNSSDNKYFQGRILKSHVIRLLDVQISTGGIIDPKANHRLPIDTAIKRGQFCYLMLYCNLNVNGRLSGLITFYTHIWAYNEQTEKHMRTPHIYPIFYLILRITQRKAATYPGESKWRHKRIRWSKHKRETHLSSIDETLHRRSWYKTVTSCSWLGQGQLIFEKISNINNNLILK